jgi:hypothetical protein
MLAAKHRLIAAVAVATSSFGWLVGRLTIAPGTLVARSPRRCITRECARIVPVEKGLERIRSASVKAAVEIVGHLGNSRRAADLAVSDRAWWPEVRRVWARGTPSQIRHLHVTDATALDDSSDFGAGHLASVWRAACLRFRGRLRATGGGDHHGGACGLSVFLVDRRKHPLICYIY